jgi:hypothetical protein
LAQAPAAFITLDLTTPASEVKAGNAFFVNYTLIRKTTCGFDFTSYLTGVDNHVRFPLRTATGWLSAGAISINEMYVVPRSTPPGRYKVSKIVVNHCSTSTFYSETFSLPITILPP